uniref:Uncharacterized protein n=1 Tax=Glossina brevipalpis TaxID=37001 RepID=A0A1A9W453_9MUSC
MDCLYANCNSKTGSDYDRFLVGCGGLGPSAVLGTLTSIGYLGKHKLASSSPQKNKTIPDTRSVACGPSPTSAVHILIPDAKAPVLVNSPAASVDLVDLSSPNPLPSEKNLENYDEDEES